MLLLYAQKYGWHNRLALSSVHAYSYIYIYIIMYVCVYVYYIDSILWGEK